MRRKKAASTRGGGLSATAAAPVVGFHDGNIRLIPLKKQGDYLTLPDDVLQGLPPLKVLDIEERP